MAIVARKSHASVAATHAISSDIYVKYFDWVFENVVFEAWSQGNLPWQLHCTGSPGSGKTTLAALVAGHLHKKYANKVAVASIFMQSYVDSNELTVLEDILNAVLDQLCCFGAEHESNSSYQKYQEERLEDAGCRLVRRIQLLRQAISFCITKITDKSIRVFLIFDGFDICNKTLNYMLEAELSSWQSSGASVMLTSRLPIFEDDLSTTCDDESHLDEEQDDLIFYWKCKSCSNILCFPCKNSDRTCNKCLNNDQMEEPYFHKDVSLNLVPYSGLRQLISWSLEREHGDLGLGSSAMKPPHSALGAAILAYPQSNRARRLVEDTYEESKGSITIAKARLDLIHAAETLGDLDAFKRRERLPPNMLSIFEAGIKGVESQSKDQCNIGLKAIGALQQKDQILLSTLQDKIYSPQSHLPRSGEDILEAARGFLVVYPDWDGNLELAAYHDHFLKYATNRYNPSIHHAGSQLRLNQPPENEVSVGHQKTLPSLSTATRFEPISPSGTPTQITPKKLSRTVTSSLDTIPEHGRSKLLVRKGTKAW